MEQSKIIDMLETYQPFHDSMPSFMNGSMIEHDGLGITNFSVDILKDMVAC